MLLAIGVPLAVIGSLSLTFGAVLGVTYAVPVILGFVALLLTVLFGEL